MLTTFPAQPQVHASAKEGRSLLFCLRIFFAFILLAGPAFASANDAATQTAPHPTSAAAHKPVHPRKRTSAAVQPAQVGQPTPATVATQEPKLPDWPANDEPTAATVVWNSQGLHIEASNSSLGQILKDVATATGAKVEGLSLDQRVFGTYGPGEARDVLSQLLEGSGYNVMMIETRAGHTARDCAEPAAEGRCAASCQRPNGFKRRE